MRRPLAAALGIWFVSLATVAAEPPAAPSATATGTVKEINEFKRHLTFLRADPELPGRTPRLDLLAVDRTATITLDDKSARLSALQPGFEVTITYNPKTMTATAVAALSRSGKDRRDEEKARLDKARAASEKAADVELMRNEMARVGRIEDARRARVAALRAAWIEAMRQQQEALRRQQASLRTSPPTGTAPTVPSGFPSGSSPTAGSRDEAAQRALLKILGAVVAHVVKDQLEGSDDPFNHILAGFARLGRDAVIESALRDVFPTRKDIEIRAIRRVICLLADRELTVANLAVETTKEEIIEALKREEPDLGTAAEVADFVYGVVRGMKRR